VRDWEAHLAQARAAVAPARLLEGTWHGEGHAHGEPVTATLIVRAILDGTVVEARERVGDHEDLSLYRWDADTQQLRVLNVAPGARMEDHPVELLPPASLLWVTGPMAPAVEWSFDGMNLRSAVTWPGARAPEVALVYRRDLAPEASGS
jgi:hypothetical protein